MFFFYFYASNYSAQLEYNAFCRTATYIDGHSTNPASSMISHQPNTGKINILFKSRTMFSEYNRLLNIYYNQ